MMIVFSEKIAVDYKVTRYSGVHTYTTVSEQTANMQHVLSQEQQLHPCTSISQLHARPRLQILASSVVSENVRAG